MQISQQWTNCSVNVAKDAMSLYAEVYAVQHLQGIPEAMQQPCGVEHTWVQAFTESAGKIGRLWQNNAQAVLRSSEQSWLTAQQAGHDVKETYTQLYNKLAALYTAS